MLDKICDKIIYHISEKNGIADSINQNFGEIRIDSYNSFSIEKILAFNNVTILINQLLIGIEMNTTIIYF